MKSGWNRLLVALNLVILSAGTPIVLAKPPIPVSAETQIPPLPGGIVHEKQSEKYYISSKQDDAKKPAATDKPETTPANLVEAIQKRQKLIEADSLYQQGQIAAAEKLYREVKTPFDVAETPKPPAPILDPASTLR